MKKHPYKPHGDIGMEHIFDADLFVWLTRTYERVSLVLVGFDDLRGIRHKEFLLC